MAEAPAYSSNLIAALRGESGSTQNPSVPSVQFMPNQSPSQQTGMGFQMPMAGGNLASTPQMTYAPEAFNFTGGQFQMPSLSGNLMQSPTTAPIATTPSQPFQPLPEFQMPSLTGNLMPAPEMQAPQPYVPPPPVALAPAPAPTQTQMMTDDEGRMFIYDPSEGWIRYRDGSDTNAD